MLQRHRPRRPDRDLDRRRRSPSTASPRTRSSARRSSGSPPQPASSRAGARRSRSGSRSRRASAAAARTPRPRSGSRTTTLERPLPAEELHALAASIGADVPFFLVDGPQLGRGDGSELTPLDLPQDYWVLLLLPHGAAKESTAAVYARFAERDGSAGAGERFAALDAALAAVRRPRDLAALPPNDLASSPYAAELLALGAFRADVTGAGPVVYGLFHHRRTAAAARRAHRRHGRTWLTVPVWYG